MPDVESRLAADRLSLFKIAFMTHRYLRVACDPLCSQCSGTLMSESVISETSGLRTFWSVVTSQQAVILAEHARNINAYAPTVSFPLY